jgi:hypothetical protein
MLDGKRRRQARRSSGPPTRLAPWYRCGRWRPSFELVSANPAQDGREPRRCATDPTSTTTARALLSLRAAGPSRPRPPSPPARVGRGSTSATVVPALAPAPDHQLPVVVRRQGAPVCRSVRTGATHEVSPDFGHTLVAVARPVTSQAVFSACSFGSKCRCRCRCRDCRRRRRRRPAAARRAATTRRHPQRHHDDTRRDDHDDTRSETTTKRPCRPPTSNPLRSCPITRYAWPAGPAPAPVGGPTPSSPPAIAQVVQQGRQLVGSVGSWAGSGAIAYGTQWYRCDASGAHCKSIHGATKSTYTLVAADVGQTLGFAVRASDAGGTTAAYEPGQAGGGCVDGWCRRVSRW